MWKYQGQQRPDFAITPEPGQESVWDYPRPPKLAPDSRRVEVVFEGGLLAASDRSIRVLETASPPTFYVPPSDVDWKTLKAAAGRSVCEWKGAARYWALSARPERGVVAWSYPAPTPAFEKIKDYVAFYPGAVDCYVAGERVRAQPGKFYGGWVTSDVVGPFKGEPGTQHW